MHDNLALGDQEIRLLRNHLNRSEVLGAKIFNEF